MENMNNLIEKIRAFNEERDWDKFHTPGNLVKSISIEAAELLECFQWDEKNYELSSVEEELADVFTYSLMLADKLNLDLVKIAENKLETTKKKYPIDKAKGVSTKYNRL